MNPNHVPDFEHRLRTLPADDALRPEHRDTLREQALTAFDRAAEMRCQAARGPRILSWGRDIMKRPVSRYVAAACVLAALVWFLAPGSSASAAFTKMVNAVVSAKSARFHAEVTIEGQPKQTAQVAFLAPAKYRMEFGKMVSISDFANAKMLTLLPDQKKAVVFNLKNAVNDPAALDKYNHFERLRQLLREQRDQQPAYERLGEHTIDGRKAIGFRFDSPIGTLTMWGDPKTGDPIRIENIYSGVPKTEVVMTQFEMNPQLDSESFTTNVPADYAVQSFDIDASKPQESDLIASLRTCAELSGGEFPDSLDTQSVIKLMVGTTMLSDKKDEQKPSDPDRLMKQAMQIGRGFQFALSLPAGAQAQYAGKGVKKDTPDRPIFWYLPDGSLRWRVVDAKLNVHDADTAPQVEGALLLQKK
jgi:outer membrane lipoprotein-sorting protein